MPSVRSRGHRPSAGELLAGIAVTYVERASVDQQRRVVPWTTIGSPTDARVLARSLRNAPRESGKRTSISAGDGLPIMMTLEPWELPGSEHQGTTSLRAWEIENLDRYPRVCHRWTWSVHHSSPHVK